MKIYIDREAALKAICSACNTSPDKEICPYRFAGCEYGRIVEIPVADVVARDCYDRILAENDQMREQLASIGKKPGDSMDDVRKYGSGVVTERKRAMGSEITATMTLTSDEWEFLKQAVDGYTYIAVDYLSYDETQMLSRMKDRIYRQMPDEVF